MNDTFVRAEPSEVWIVCESAEFRTEVGHQFFDIAPDQPKRQLFNSAANQIVTFAHRQHQPGAADPGVERDIGHGKGVFRR